VEVDELGREKQDWRFGDILWYDPGNEAPMRKEQKGILARGVAASGKKGEIEDKSSKMNSIVGESCRGVPRLLRKTRVKTRGVTMKNKGSADPVSRTKKFFLMEKKWIRKRKRKGSKNWSHRRMTGCAAEEGGAEAADKGIH